MPLLPFNVSYLIFTPKRVRLPGEASSPGSPTKSRSKRSTDFPTKAKSLRSLVGAKVPQPQKENPTESSV
ncbi:hypothetical protein GALMADRAFT_240834 [Galerina marginata CBS 339.88]|uniref:Uncharacterized protein n=1 Tax=Galerina marginata (strain CBS 339.88) TaxID=685588 RepID=A0A067TBM8_GALM3|nr:hypothetical protein GALMADRAFT_240834 [Galerina marginata CBS 339.88]